MRSPRKWLIAAAVLTAACIAAEVLVSLLVARGLRQAMTPLGEMTGVKAGIGRTRFALLPPALKASRVNLGNPEGFAEPSLFAIDRGSLGVSLLHLPFSVLKIPRARLEGVSLHVIRNADGAINLLSVAQAMETYEREHPPAGKTAESGGALILRNARANGVITFVDHQAPSAKPFALDLALELEADRIATKSGRRPKDGTFTLRGHAADDPSAFVIDFRGTVAPLTNADRPTFEVHGSIDHIDMNRLGYLTTRAGVQSEAASVQVDLFCADGRFDAARSLVVATLDKARLTGKLAHQAGINRPLPRLTVSMPVAGTTAAPQFDWITALSDTLFKDFGHELNRMFQDSGLNEVDRKGVNQTLDKALRGLSDLFAPQKKK